MNQTLASRKMFEVRPPAFLRTTVIISKVSVICDVSLVREASLRNYSLSIFHIQFYFLLSVFYFLLLLFLLLFVYKAQTDIKAIAVLFKTNVSCASADYRTPNFSFIWFSYYYYYYYYFYYYYYYYYYYYSNTHMA